ncbi:hypothetical protein AQUSIP_05240 [Aquicella siphonis]|uniref:Uncharacterized protein n=1 Tax=Aquicella siphonis TaxID=254247 RepID=A0A5E4PFW2_9COXI|nr:hypothetical protein [Aquicella siphonis]VVC75236.1 hypothetical protein AQUSIP_05240 [Aquicella siphonis]
MKKMLTTLAATASIVAVSFAFAAAKVDSGVYYSTQHPKAGMKALAVPATNITVTNYSDELIFAVVPGSPIDDRIGSGKSDTISNDSYYGDTHLVLLDWNRSVFFDQNVCRRAIVTVDGRPGSYHIDVNRKFCN